MARKYNLNTSDIAFYNDKIYFSAQEFNGLFYADLNGGEAVLVSKFPDECNSAKRLHNVVLRYEDQLLFFPDLSNHLVLYDIKSGIFEKFAHPFPDDITEFGGTPKVATAILVGHCAYFMGERCPCIGKFDFKTRSITLFDNWFQEYMKYGYRKEATYFCKDIGIIKNSIFAKTHQNSVIIEFDTLTEKIFFHPVGKVLSSVLCCDENKIWFFREEGKNISCWDINNNTISNFELGQVLGDKECAYQCSVATKMEIWLFPYRLELPVLVFDKSTETFSKRIFDITEKECFDIIPGYIRYRQIYNNCLYFMPIADNRLYCFSGEDGTELYSTDIYIDKDKYVREIYGEGKRYNLEQHGDCYTHTFSVADYVCMVNKGSVANTKKIKGKYGYRINQAIKQGMENMEE